MSDRDKILSKTNGGFDVFVHYMGEVCSKKLFRNPFREDTAPSCHIYYRKSSERFFLKDFGDSNWCGDCFWFVSKLTKLDVRRDFSKILHTIDTELQLYVLDDKTSAITHPIIKKTVTVEPPKDSRLVNFVPQYRNFNKFELAYWQSYGITTDVLERYNVKCLSSCRFERTDGTYFNIYSTKETPMFGYVFNNGSGIKTYRPGVTIGRFLYAGNLSYPYVFGFQQLDLSSQCTLNIFQSFDNFKKGVLFITGGEKDVLSLASRGFNAICFNSESAKAPKSVMSKFFASFELIVFLYDVDEAGKRDSALRIEECKSYGFTDKQMINVHLPLDGTKKEKDASDFFRLGHSTAELYNHITRSIFN